MNMQIIRIPADYSLRNMDFFHLLTVFWNEAHASGWTTSQLMKTTEDAMSGDDNHLRYTLAKYCAASSDGRGD